MFKKLTLLTGLAATLFFMSGCTDLADNIQDGIGRETGDDGPAEITDPTSALVGVYSQLNGLRGAGETFALMEHPSDEMIGPTRGTDWSDFELRDIPGEPGSGVLCRN